MPVITVRHNATTVNLSILKFIFFILRLGSLGLSKIGFVGFPFLFHDQVRSLEKQ